MNGKVITRAPSGARINLSDAVPLERPLSIRISPTSQCNLKCQYCIHSDAVYLKTHPTQVMKMDIYTRLIDDIKDSFSHVKQLFLCGIGEPLLNPHIADMVAYAVKQDVADVVEIVTNGTTLTREVSDALIRAGLTRLRISINGLSDEDYLRHCGAKVRFDKMVEEIAYLYQNRGETQVYIKTIDYMLQTPEQKERFFEMFQPLCDQICVESLIRSDREIDYLSFVGEDYAFSSTQSNTKLLDTKICSMPFYTLTIDEVGKAHVCCDKNGMVLGDAREQSVKEIWSGKPWMRFCMAMLDGKDHAGEGCRDCSSMQFRVYPEDCLDGHTEEIRQRIESRAARNTAD